MDSNPAQIHSVATRSATTIMPMSVCCHRHDILYLTSIVSDAARRLKHPSSKTQIQMSSQETSSFINPDVKRVFDNYPAHVRPRMLALRQLVLDTAAGMEEVGALEETLKWGEPSYLTSKTKSGSTIRMDWKPRAPDSYAMYFNCQTTLVSTFRQIYSDQLAFEGNRSVVFQLADELEEDAVRHCIAMALTYHLDKKKRAKQ